MNLIIAGSRTFNDYKLLEQECKKFIVKIGYLPNNIVSGECRGADKLGELFAEKYKIPIMKFPANWDKYGKQAGMIRNVEMAKNASHCIIFWDGKSLGSKHMIEQCEKYFVTYKIVNYEKIHESG